MKEKPQKTKTEWQRKTYPLKLKIQPEHQTTINTYLNEYTKITNFIITKTTQQLFPTYKQLPKEQWHEGNCYLCNKQKTLRFTFTAPDQTKHHNCGCLNGHYSLRKIFLPSKNYKITDYHSTPEYDMRLAGNLYIKKQKFTPGGDQIPGGEYNRTAYDSCLQKAVETIKSQNEINQQINNKIKWLEQNNQTITQLLKNQEIDKKFETLKKYPKQKLKKFLTKQ